MYCKEGSILNFKPTEGVCYRPDLYYDGVCNNCRYKNYTKCHHNGYTKFADMSKNNTEEAVNITNDTPKKKKRGRKKFHK